MYKRTGVNWAQEAYIKASNNDASDQFGQSVSISGDTLAVATKWEDSNQSTITNGTTASADNTNSNSGAVYVYKRSGSSWAQEAYIKAANNGSSDNFGFSVSVSGDTLAVGAREEDSNQTTITNGTTASADNSNSNSGAVYVYKRSGSSWAQEAYIKAANNEINDYFGSSISISGDTLTVSASGEDSNQTSITNGTSASANNSNADSGAVYVYKRTGSNWAQEAYIKASNNEAWDSLGTSISISGDTLAVGAYAEDSNQTTITNGTTASSNNSAADSGAVYIYRNAARLFDPGDIYIVSTTSDTVSLSWASAGSLVTGYKIAYSSGSTPPADCSSGTIIDVGNVTTYDVTGLSGDTTYSFRICSYDASSSLSEGQTFSAETYPQSWVQEAYIKAANNRTNYAFGGSVSISGDTLVVGSFAESSNQTTITNGATASSNTSNTSSGAVYVYKRSGVNWAQEAYIKAVNNDANDWFGYSVSISRDTLAVGAYQEDSNQTSITNGTTASADNSNNSSGAVYIYKRTGVNWAQEAYIKAVNNDANDYFGYSVSISGDTLVVGANMEDSSQTTITNGTTASADNTNSASGAVYVYKRSGVNWTQQAYIKAANNDASDQFGYSVSISGDTLAVGAFGEDSNQTSITNGTTASSNNSSSQSGAVYVYKRSGTTWAQEAYIKAVNNDIVDNLGYQVRLFTDTLAVTAYFEASNQTTITNGTTASADNSNSQSGAVYVYKRSGTTWAQEAYIKAANNDANDLFGTSISISGDTIAVGAYQEDSNQITITNGTTASANNSNTESGAVYVYKRSGVNWTQEAYIKAANNNANDRFGYSVSISGDTIAVGADSEASNQTTITNGTTASSNNSNAQSGAVYIYRNSTRLFDVDEIWSTSDSSSVTLTWNKSGGTATTYLVAYDVGSTPPADCASGTVIDAGDVSTENITGLLSSTTYSFRVCAAEDVSTYSTGTTVSVTTAP
ncbi:MAG: beta strand repeat-containing protein [Bacteriovoracaceae bacterium]